MIVCWISPYITNWPPLIKFTLVCVSACFMVTKAAFNGNNSIIVPCKDDTARMVYIMTKSYISA
nr:MAG TPA: hypothetical protein [Caudoviricetes sp.]